MDVHKELGCGFLEAVYQEALEREFTSQQIPFKPQPIIQIAYKGKPLDKTYQPDFVCYEEVIVEIKAISGLAGLEEAQLINYLKATGLGLSRWSISGLFTQLKSHNLCNLRNLWMQIKKRKEGNKDVQSH